MTLKTQLSSNTPGRAVSHHPIIQGFLKTILKSNKYTREDETFLKKKTFGGKRNS